MNKEVKITIIIMISATVLLLGVIAYYANSEIKRLDEETIRVRTNKVALVSSHFEQAMQNLAGAIELTSKIPVIAEPPAHSDMVSDEMKGIPDNLEIKKRTVAKDLLENFDFNYIFYALPNGDQYLLEPYPIQLKTSVLNFAFRDWYEGTVSSGSTYVSEVYISKNTGHNVVAITTPLYDNGVLNGFWVGTLDLTDSQKILEQITLGENEHMLIADHNNNIVVDTRSTKSDTELQKIPWDLKEQSNGQTKTTTQTIDGENMFVTFRSIPIGTHQWLVMTIQPYNDAFSSSAIMLTETILLVVTIIAIMSATGFFVIRKIIANINLSKRLEETNSELQIKTEQLGQIDIAKDEFSAMVTHELKTPLVPIIGYCKMFKTSMFGKLTDEQANAIDVIEKNTKGLEKLINDIMDARKLDIDKMKFKFEDLELHDFFEGLSTSYEKVLKDKGIEFVTNLDLKNVVIHADSSRLRQVFDNLISNAIKFVPQNGLVEVGGYKEGEDVILYVKDNGVGITEEKQKNLFKKFYQIDTTERRPIGGTGLGLAISRGIMERLGGSIWVESDGSTGTTFYLRLPAKSF